jgi:dynein assembly factor 5
MNQNDGDPQSNDFNSSAVNQALNKFTQSLKDTNKITRKNGLECLKKQINESFKPTSSTVLKFSDDSLKLILKLNLNILNDQAEKCREISVDIVKILLENFKNWDEESTSSVIMSIFQRLDGKEVKETSEEIRLQLYSLLHQLIEIKSIEQLHTFEIHLTELIGLMQNAVNDNYPDVKKVGCQCSKLLANRLSKANFHMQSEILVKALLANIVHQHSRVRKDIIECLCDVVTYGNNKSVSDAVSHLAQRLFDQASLVRLAVVKLVATWLLDLPDRYSYHHRLIPLLLTGFVDESIEIKEVTESLWWDVGVKYEKENEQDLKDKADFLNHDLTNYPVECNFKISNMTFL